MHDGVAKSDDPLKRAPLVVWTRSAADLATDRPFLDQQSVQIIHIPCIRSEVIQSGINDLRKSLIKENRNECRTKKSYWMIFTSQNAVKVLEEACAKDPDLAAALKNVDKIITHGRQTAATASAVFGEKIQCMESVTSEQFAAKVATVLKTINQNPAMLWPCALEHAFDVVEHLVGQGNSATRIPVYRTSPAPSDEAGRPLDEEGLKAKAEQIAARVRNAKCVVCFASPSAVEGWLRLTQNTPFLSPRSLTAAVIGPTTGRAAATAGFGNIVVSAWPNLQDLISLGASCAGSGEA
jgi:uroporphyrinogen-III synthase